MGKLQESTDAWERSSPSETANPEDFITSLEANLKQEDIPAKYWKTALVIAVIPKVKLLVREMVTQEDFSYMANAVLDCSGLNSMQAADLFLDISELK